MRRLTDRFFLLPFSFAFCLTAAIASPAPTLTTLASFDGSNGESPDAGLIPATDRNFYGTTATADWERHE
jgi:hypothetical protein